MSTPRRWIFVVIVLLAFSLRILWLDAKPAHFDEGVNGWFVDQMTKQGYYHYDPTNFHGPLHFYVLFLSQTLLGRSEWALRLPIVLISTLCVAFLLAFRRHLDERVCLIAAAMMAVSPAMIFYGRYAIHETWLLLFLLLIAWGLPGLWRFGDRRSLWAVALGLTGLILTKETYIIHVIAFLLAMPCLLLFEKLSPSAAWPFGGWKFSLQELGVVSGVCLGLILFFYTGAFLDWSSLPGLWETFQTWVHTGTAEKSGHEKEWYYWLQLLARYEWPALAGLVAGLWLLWPRTSRVLRYLAIAGLGAFIGYSIVPYKTPWCIISIIWPFYFLLGAAVVAAADRIDRWTIGTLAALLVLGSAGVAWQLNFHHATDETEPYVYVQTFEDANLLLTPLRTLARRDARNYHLRGHLILAEQYPWVWQLGDFPRVDFPAPDELPAALDADFLVLDEPMVEEVEPQLEHEYFKVPIRLRGNSDLRASLYLSTTTFANFKPPGATTLIPAQADITPAEPALEQ